jgi:hypothetical protein
VARLAAASNQIADNAATTNGAAPTKIKKEMVTFVYAIAAAITHGIEKSAPVIPAK